MAPLAEDAILIIGACRIRVAMLGLFELTGCTNLPKVLLLCQEARSGPDASTIRTAFAPRGPTAENAIFRLWGATLDLVTRACASVSVVLGWREGADAVSLKLLIAPAAPFGPLGPHAIRGVVPSAWRALARPHLREHGVAGSSSSFGSFFNASHSLFVALSASGTVLAFKRGAQRIASVPLGPFREGARHRFQGLVARLRLLERSTAIFSAVTRVALDMAHA